MISILCMVGVLVGMACIGVGIALTVWTNYDTPSDHSDVPKVVLKNLDTAKKLGPVLLGVGIVGLIALVFAFLHIKHKRYDSDSDKDTELTTISSNSPVSSNFGFRFY